MPYKLAPHGSPHLLPLTPAAAARRRSVDTPVRLRALARGLAACCRCTAPDTLPGARGRACRVRSAGLQPRAAVSSRRREPHGHRRHVPQRRDTSGGSPGEGAAGAQDGSEGKDSPCQAATHGPAVAEAVLPTTKLRNRFRPAWAHFCCTPQSHPFKTPPSPPHTHRWRCPRAWSTWASSPSSCTRRWCCPAAT